MTRSAWLAVLPGSALATVILSRAAGAGLSGAAALGVLCLACGALTGWAFGHRERDIAFSMPYATAVAAFAGALLMPLALYILLIVVLVMTHRVE